MYILCFQSFTLKNFIILDRHAYLQGRREEDDQSVRLALPFDSCTRREWLNWKMPAANLFSCSFASLHKIMSDFFRGILTQGVTRAGPSGPKARPSPARPGPGRAGPTCRRAWAGLEKKFDGPARGPDF